MATFEPEALQDRNKRTVWLLAAGAASLLVPLAGAVYLHWSQNAGAAGPSGRSDIFERREGGEQKVLPTQSAVITSPSALMAPQSGMVARVEGKATGSSLDFIKNNTELHDRIADSKTAMTSAAAPSAPATSAAAAPSAPAAAPAARTTGKAKKSFVMPKLKPSRGFTNFGSGAKGAGNAGSQSGSSPEDLLSNLPAGSENNPQIQQYLKSRQGQ